MGSEAAFSSKSPVHSMDKSKLSNLPEFEKLAKQAARAMDPKAIKKIFTEDKNMTQEPGNLKNGISIDIKDQPDNAYFSRSKSPSESKQRRMSRVEDMSARQRERIDSNAGKSVRNQKSMPGCHFVNLCKEMESYADDWEAYAAG